MRYCCKEPVATTLRPPPVLVHTDPGGGESVNIDSATKKNGRPKLEQGGILTAGIGFIAKHRAALIDFLEDYVSAIRWRENPETAPRRSTSFPASRSSPRVFSKAGSWYRARITEMVTANIHVEQELGLVKEALDAKEYADLGPLKEALAGLK